MRHLIDQQGARVPLCPPQMWRHKAPTGAPACTPVHAGGEGTTSTRATDRADGGGWIARATLPNGVCKRFRLLQCFDGYVAVWRAAGFLLTWQDPRTVFISRGGLDAGPQRTTESLAPVLPPSTPHAEAPQHGQARFGHCQARLVRAPLPFGQHRAVFLPRRSRGHLSVHQAGAVRLAVALGRSMSQQPAQPAFAWWTTPTTRALHRAATQPAMGLHRRPFSGAKAAPQRPLEALRATAQIFPFTGSNTPYESHE